MIRNNMNKPKRMILCDFPNNACNLRCEYCYITQLPDWARMREKRKYSNETIIKGLSAKRLGGPCIINLTGTGETMLEPGLVELCEGLVKEGHFIEVVTNLTLRKVIDKFINLPSEIQKHIEFKVSFHYMEHIQRNTLDSFFENLELVQNSDISFALELMPYDRLVPEIDNIIKICEEKTGAKCQVTVGRKNESKSEISLLTSGNKEDFVRNWEVFDSPMFDFKMKLLDVKRKEFCYAGDWTLRVNLYSGEACPCYSQPYRYNIFDNIDKPIDFVAVGNHCAMPFCINGHAHMCLGVIPEYDAPTFEHIRNRTRKDGTEWFSKECKEFFSHKLYESNKEYSLLKKITTNIGWYFRAAFFAIKYPKKIFRRIKLYFTKF